MIPPFAAFACIDWSGARGERQPGIAVAEAAAGASAPALVAPPRGRWSRAEVADWIAAQRDRRILIGLDLSFAFPFADRGAYFPGLADPPVTARALWAYVEAHSAAEPHFEAHGLVAAFADHFRIGALTGALFERSAGNGRMRRTETAARALGVVPHSCFNLVGAAQVGRASLTGMRVLHALGHRIPVWPFDDDTGRGALIVEIYTSIAARAAGLVRGTKIRTGAALDRALSGPAIGSAPIGLSGPVDDHRSDALLAAAWLRRAAPVSGLWSPAGLAAVRATEGWTFGVP